MTGSIYYPSHGSRPVTNRNYTEILRPRSGTVRVIGSAPRASESYTKTTTKKKKSKTMQVEEKSASNEYLTIGINYKTPKKVCKGTTFKYFEGRNKLTESDAGKQTCDMLFYYGTSQQFRLPPGTANAPTSVEASKAYFDLNPNRATTGSNAYPATSTITPDQIFWKGGSLELDMVNMSNCASYTDLYFMIPKDNLENGEDPVSNWVSAASEDGLGIGGEGIGGAGTSTATFGTVAYTHVGAKPDQHKGFNQKWKILKVKKVQLAGGGTHRMMIHLKHNTLVNLQSLTTTDTVFCRKKTIAIMAVTRGAALADTTGTGCVPTYGGVRVGYVMNARLTFNTVYGAAARLNTVAGAQLYPSGTANADQGIINILDAVSNLAEVS